MVKEALKDKDATHFHLVSDSDTMCRPLQEMIDFFADPANSNKNFIECAPAEEVWELNRVRERYYCWNIHDIIDTRRFHLGLVNRYFTRFQWKLHIRRKPFPYKILYGGNTWWSLTREGAETLLRAYEDKNIFNRFRYTYAPDEIFPSTVIGNSELPIESDFCLRARSPKYAKQKSFRFIPWWHCSPKGVHPLTLLSEDYDDIKQSGAFIARKVALPLSKPLLEKLNIR